MKLKNCLENINRKEYEGISLWAKNNFAGWYMSQMTTPSGLHVHWLTKVDLVPQERLFLYLNREVLETFVKNDVLHVIIN